MQALFLCSPPVAQSGQSSGLQSRGLRVRISSRGLNSLTPYLSRCEQFKDVGKGIWALNDDDAIPSYDELSDNVGAMAMNGPPMFTD